MMKLGFGLYKHMLNDANYRFAAQCGATHLVIHSVDYFNTQDSANQPAGGSGGWGRAGDPDALWTLEELLGIKTAINEAGLELYAIENFDPAFWYDVLLDGPKKAEQMENLKELIRPGRCGGDSLFRVQLFDCRCRRADRGAVCPRRGDVGRDGQRR